jgi:hypothetical protein
MTQGEILAAGEAAAYAIVTHPGGAPRAFIQEMIEEAAKLFVDDPAHHDLDAVANATNDFIKAIRGEANALFLAIAKPAGGVH